MMRKQGWLITVGVLIVIAVVLVARLSRNAPETGKSQAGHGDSGIPRGDASHPEGVAGGQDGRSTGTGVSHPVATIDPKPETSENTFDGVLSRLRSLRRSDDGRFGEDTAPAEAELITQLVRMGEAVLPRIRDVLFSDHEPLEVREALLKVLGYVKGRASVEILSEAVQSAFLPPALRNRALASLRFHLETIELRSKIFETAYSVYMMDRAFQGRSSLIGLMGESKDARAVPVMIQVLEQSGDRGLRPYAAKALAPLVDQPGVGPALRRCIDAGEDLPTMHGAILALSESRLPDVPGYFERLLEGDIEYGTAELIRRVLKEKFNIER